MQFQSVHDSAMQLQTFAGQEGMAASRDLALVSVVHVRVEMNVVVRLRRKLLIAVCIGEWGIESMKERMYRNLGMRLEIRYSPITGHTK